MLALNNKSAVNLLLISSFYKLKTMGFTDMASFDYGYLAGKWQS